MSKAPGRAYKGFVPLDELPFRPGDCVALRAGTIIYSRDQNKQTSKSSPCLEAFSVTIESIDNGCDGSRDSTTTPECFDPSFCWTSNGQRFAVRFQDLLEQGAIPPRQKYS